MIDTYNVLWHVRPFVHCTKDSRNVVLFTLILFIKSQGCATYLQCLLLKTKYNRPSVLFTLLEVIYQTLGIVFHWDIRTVRRELKL